MVVVTKTTGDWLREHRQKLGLRQEDVARRAGVSTSYISTLERGQKHTTTDVDIQPEREKVVSIAKALQGNPDELLLLYGYAPDSLTNGRPQTVPELMQILERAGVDGLQFADGDDALRHATPDDLREVLDAVRLAVEITIQRQSQNKKE